MQRDLPDAVSWAELDTSIQQARSRIDGRVYPVQPLSDDQTDELAQCLGIAVDQRVAWVLNDAVRASVRNLAAFFDSPSAEVGAAFEADRLVALQKIALDPARALGEPTLSEGASAAVDLLVSLAEARGIDPETRIGSVAVGNMAADMVREKRPRADAHFTIGEAQLFDDIMATIAAIAPAAVSSWPGNDPTPRKGALQSGDENLRHPAVTFAEEFVGQVADRAVASFPADGRVRKRLYKLKGKSTQAILKALRAPRAWLRANEALSEPATDQFE